MLIIEIQIVEIELENQRGVQHQNQDLLAQIDEIELNEENAEQELPFKRKRAKNGSFFCPLLS
jgi:hypothetical protein